MSGKYFRIFEAVKPFYFLLLFFSISCKCLWAQDSITIYTESGKSFVSHVVEPHQNLYRLSRHYQLTTQEIKIANQLDADTLKKGMELLIPLTKKNFTIHPNFKKKGFHCNPLNASTSGFSSAKKMATLLPIDKDAWMDFAKKKQLNFKKNNAVFVGWLETFDIELTPPKPVKSDIAELLKKKLAAKNDSIKLALQIKMVADSLQKIAAKDSIQKRNQPNSQQVFFEKLYNRNEALETNEEGTALSMIPDTLGNYQKGFYGFHNTLPTGAIVKLKNPMNENEVYVKILGKIPELMGNARCTIKISHDAALYLDARDERFLVSIFHH